MNTGLFRLLPRPWNTSFGCGGPSGLVRRPRQRWRRALELYVFPKLGTFRVSDIETHHVGTVLEAVAAQAPTSVSKVRQQIAAVTAWAVGQGYRPYDPCGPALDAVSPSDVVSDENHQALPYAQVAEALAIVRGCDAWTGTRLLLEFLVLTVVRTNEARQARWSEVDFAAAMWVVPGARMKERKEHDVPLSSPALAVLREARDHPDLEQARRRSGDCSLVFPSMKGRVLYNNALSMLLRDLEIDCVPHGFRSSFADWTTETRISSDVGQACLSHAVGNAVWRRYSRTKRYNLRVTPMEDWGRFVVPDRSVAYPRSAQLLSEAAPVS